MREFLLQQRGYAVFFNSFHFLLFLFLVLYFFLVFLPGAVGGYATLFPLLISVLFLAEVLQALHKVYLRKHKRPRITLKSLLVMGSTLIIEMGIFLLALVTLQESITPSRVALFLALLALLDDDINASVVFFFNACTRAVKTHLFKKARSKRLSFPDLKVVGITGSYGKSSVKEILTHLLEGQFKVVKTEKNTNTEIGIAQTILKKVKQEHEVFVCEMGAYSSGEVKVCCFMAKPEIGVFTGLNEQHGALFGSLDKTFRAKWELALSLPPEGILIVNTDSSELADRLKTCPGLTLACSTHSGEYRAEHIEITPDSVSFQYQGVHFLAPLVGGFQVVNLLMSVVAAEQLGMSLSDIAERMKTVRLPSKTLTALPFSQGIILDDSYNVNPDGLRGALAHLDLYEDYQKVLFFPGILELGESSEDLHRELGEQIGQHVDYVFFFDPNFSEILSKAAFRGGLTREHVFTLETPDLMAEQLSLLFEHHKGKKWVLLFESRGAEMIMDSLLN
ncbi:MAG: UDP-N-acetylmuramoyl-tripeptide--D-alanyl-D-alanine ligase [bacterium]|nr:UDP-N-acetylmuramoyl-tripeptide--D-alanyl-D-alanine ligase [bacterium]